MKRSPPTAFARIAAADATARFGAVALALAPRVVALDRERVRFELRAGVLSEHDAARLAAAGGSLRASTSGGWCELAIERAALADLAGASPALAALDSALRAVARAAPAPELMGVLNATPDSFSDGGALAAPGALVAAARRLADEGAAWLDVGGESTRPGAAPVTLDEELARIGPLFEALGPDAPARLSIDTTKAPVAAFALDAGAAMVNDVSAGRFDPGMLPLVAERGAPVCLMHLRGEPRDMQERATYEDVVREVTEELRARCAAALAAGVRPEAIAIDPGIGFAKTAAHNLALLARLGELRSLGLPIVLGVSRKAFLGALTGRERPTERVHGTAAAVALGVRAGAALLRVHDVAAMREVVAVAAAVRDAGGSP